MRAGVSLSRGRERGRGEGNLLLQLAIREPGRLLGGPQQGAGLVAGLLVFRLRVAVGDDAAARLDVERAVLDDARCAARCRCRPRRSRAM